MATPIAAGDRGLEFAFGVWGSEFAIYSSPLAARQLALDIPSSGFEIWWVRSHSICSFLTSPLPLLRVLSVTTAARDCSPPESRETMSLWAID
jgi:hypothetical protein